MVDFPQPDSPTRPTTSPRLISNEASRTACTAPVGVKKVTESPSTFSRGWSAPAIRAVAVSSVDVIVVAIIASLFGNSLACLMPSASRLTPITSDATAAAGASATHGAPVMKMRLSLIMSPQSEDGGCTPSPRNPSDATSRIE